MDRPTPIRINPESAVGHSHFHTTAKYLHVSMRRLQQLPQLLEGLVLPARPVLPTAATEGQP